MIGVLDIPATLSFEVVRERDDEVTVRFSPDRHVSSFPSVWLFGQLGPPEGDGRTEADKQCWRARDLLGTEPVADWSRYERDPAVRLAVLADVVRLGFAILRGTPTCEGTVLEVASTFGYVRETNYGRLFDVRAEAGPTNLAYTALAIAPHTDNPYRDPVPTLQLLHCLSNAVEGGESGLLDGFEAGRILRAENGPAFHRLTSTPVTFAWSDEYAVLAARRPLIVVDPLGRIREIRFNPRSMQAVRLPREELDDFYVAYRHLSEILARPELQLSFRLEPGDCVILDNTRVLHSRTAFSETASGRRHLQGCYADIDGLQSTVAVLRLAAPQPQR